VTNVDIMAATLKSIRGRARPEDLAATAADLLVICEMHLAIVRDVSNMRAGEALQIGRDAGYREAAAYKQVTIDDLQRELASVQTALGDAAPYLREYTETKPYVDFLKANPQLFEPRQGADEAYSLRRAEEEFRQNAERIERMDGSDEPDDDSGKSGPLPH